MCRRGVFYFTVALLFIRIPTGVASIKKEEVAAQVFESELLFHVLIYFLNIRKVPGTFKNLTFEFF